MSPPQVTASRMPDFTAAGLKLNISSTRQFALSGSLRDIQAVNGAGLPVRHTRHTCSERVLSSTYYRMPGRWAVGVTRRSERPARPSTGAQRQYIRTIMASNTPLRILCAMHEALDARVCPTLAPPPGSAPRPLSFPSVLRTFYLLGLVEAAFAHNAPQYVHGVRPAPDREILARHRVRQRVLYGSGSRKIATPSVGGRRYRSIAAEDERSCLRYVRSFVACEDCSYLLQMNVDQ